ncbi:glycosyltransferase family 2 protein, partial [Patescibacteria group bacterium]|nr:glycosyltransferase family 2 protein [Patescibacteria group bacterium]
MKLSILIVNYNQKYFPRLCVESLRKSRVDFPYEIIVCDNSSKDESLGYLREADSKGELKLIEAGRNLGYGAGMNLAGKEATGKYVVVLNADVTVEADTLQKMVDYMEKNNEVGMLAPKLVYHNGDVQPSCRRNFRFLDLFIKRSFLKKVWPFRVRYQKYIMVDFNHQSVQKVDLVTGAFMMMPRDLYEQVRGFDERYFLFMED